nr:hypothetical protein CFP56_38811 [Quercus suber]
MVFNFSSFFANRATCLRLDVRGKYNTKLSHAAAKASWSSLIEYGSITLRSKISESAYVGPAEYVDVSKPLWLPCPCHGILTAPRRTAKNDSLPRHRLQAFMQLLKHITLHPPNFIRNAVDFRIVLRARKDFWITLDRPDLIPTTRKRKSDSISASASKGVNDDRRGRGGGGDMGRNSTELVSVI